MKLVENGVTRLFHNGVYTKSIYPAVSETHPLGEWGTTKAPTCTEPGEKQRSCTVSGCVVTETEELPALGHQWSDWTPVEGGSREYRICAVCNAVEYRDVSHNSGFIIPTNLRVLDSTQTDILQNAQLVRLNQINDVLYIDVALETASLQGVLSDLTGLRSENIETIVFSTERCTSTLSLRCCSPRCGRYAFHPQPQRLHRHLHRGRRRPQRTAEVSRSPSSIPST